MQKTNSFRELVARVLAVFESGCGESQKSISDQQVAGCANPLRRGPSLGVRDLMVPGVAVTVPVGLQSLWL